MARLYTRYQSGRAKPQALPLDVALGRAQIDRVPMVGTRLYPTAEEAADGQGQEYAYLPVIDFDGASAVRDCAAFVAQVLRPAGLRPGDDVWVAASSPGRRKLYWRRPWGVWGGGWAEGLRGWLTSLKEAYPSIDPAQATVSVARWLGSQHLSGRPVWCREVGLRGDAATSSPASPQERAAWCSLGDPHTDAVGRQVQIYHLLHRVEEWSHTRRAARVIRTATGRTVRRTFDLDRLVAATGLDVRPIRGGVRLRTCPLCGGHTVAAVFYGSCVLHCLRTSCPAAIGMAPQHWVPQDLHAACQIESEEAPRVAIRRVPLDVARVRARAAVEEALDAEDGASPVVLRVTPGVGKSFAAIHAVVERARRGRRYLITTPTRELAAETLAAVEALPHAPRALVLEARDGGNCTQIARAAAASDRGYSPGRAVCPSCPDRDWCTYQAHLAVAATTPILIGAWEHEELLRGGRLGARDLVVDEAPVRVRLEDVRIAPEELLRWQVAGLAVEEAADVGQVAGWLLRACEGAATAGTVPGAALAEAVRVIGSEGSSLAAADRVIADAALAVERLRAYESGALRGEDAPTILSRPSLRVLDAVVEIDRLRRAPQTSTGLRCHARSLALARLRRPAQLPRLVLDAYARGELYDRLLGVEADVVRIDAEIPARVARVDAPTSKGALRRDGTWEVVRESVRSLLRGGHRRLLVVASAGTLDAAMELAREEAAAAAARSGVAVEVVGRHAYAGAGSNAYAECTAVVALITPSLRPEDAAALTSALYAGEARVVPGDGRLDLVRAVWGADELLQQIHRARPAIRHPERTRDVVVITSADTELADLDGEAMAAGEVGDAAWVEGVTRRHGAWVGLLGGWLASPRDPKRERRALARSGVAVQVGQHPRWGRLEYGGDAGLAWGLVDRIAAEAARVQAAGGVEVEVWQNLEASMSIAA